MSAPSETDRLLAERAITAVQVRYARALDDRDWDRLATCFADDAVADYGGYGGQLHGVDAICDGIRRALRNLDASQHLLGNHELWSLDDDAATAACEVVAQHYRRGVAGGEVFTVGAAYRDRLVRTGDGWRIAARTLQPRWEQGNRAVFERDPAT